jgi:exodeoxyribonuclease V gamma subunit
MAPVVAAVRALGAGELREPLDVDLQLDAFRITGRIADARQKGLLQFRAGTIAGRDLLRAWLRHLVWNAVPGDHGELASFMVGTGGRGEVEVQRFKPVPDASARLQELLKLYEQGQRAPLKFFPESAFAMLKQGRSKKEPLDRARDSWRGGEWKRGECEDEYYDLFFRDADPIDEEFAKVAELIVAPLLLHCEEAHT